VNSYERSLEAAKLCELPGDLSGAIQSLDRAIKLAPDSEERHHAKVWQSRLERERKDQK
jgi:hypothetical protein